KLLLAAESTEKLSGNLNAEIALNHHQTSADGTSIDRVRSYALELALTLGRYAGGSVDFSAAGKVMRAKLDDRTIASFQARSNLYLARGLTVPIALTYANHTDGSPKSQVRLNFGLSLDADAFLGAARSHGSIGAGGNLGQLP